MIYIGEWFMNFARPRSGSAAQSINGASLRDGPEPRATLVQFAGGHDPGPLAHDLDAGGSLTDTLRQLLALAESYPDLKASTNIQQLQAKLADLANAEKAVRRKAEGESEQRGGKAFLSAQGVPANAPTTRSTSAAMLTIAAISLMIVSFLIASVILTVFG
jgi:LemA family